MVRSTPVLPTAHLQAHDFFSSEVVRNVTEFPWFNVTVQVQFEEGTRSEGLMVPSLEALKKILKLQSGSFEVNAIHYVTPGYMNESGEWKMERLLDISELFNEFGWSIPRCTVEGNRVYRGIQLVRIDEWTTVQQVYSAP